MDLAELIERERIRDVIFRYCEAIDASDWNVVMACFTDDATITHGNYNGSAATFLGFIQGVLTKMNKTVHVIGSTRISIDGDHAQMSAVYSSFHSIAGKHEKAGPVKTGGVDTDWLVAGRYVDDLVKIDGDWKIKNRAATTDWTRVEPSNPN